MVQRPKRDTILLGSACFFAVLVAVAVAISLVLASRVDDTISNLNLHAAAMRSGTAIQASDAHSLTSLTRQVSGLQPITYGIIAGSLAMLYGTLVALIWIDRLRHAQTKQAIESAALAEELRVAEESRRVRNQELELLFDISGTFAEGGTFDQMAQRIVQRLSVLPGADWVTLRLPDEKRERLKLIGAAGNGTDTAPSSLSTSFGENLAHLAFRRGTPVIVNDYPADPNASRAIVDLGIKSMALVTADDRTLGLFSISSQGAGSFSPDRVRILTSVVDGIGPLFEIARLEGQRRQEQEQLQETLRLASIGELAAGVAHELNNPLTSVLGYSQMILDSEVPESLKSNLRVVVSEGQRAAKVIKNLQLFARRTGPEKTFENVNSILQRAVDLKLHDFDSSNLKIICDFGEDVPSTMIDENQLVQVFVNILTNAQQSLEASNKQGHVSIRSSASREKIEICIQDNGGGIPKDQLGKIFEPFFTTKEVGSGTGLGLSICYGIVKQNGGLLWAESVEGEGAAFYIEFPIISADGETKEVDESGPPITTIKYVLAVDDEPEIRTLLRRTLEVDQISVDLAKDGVEAWQMVQEKPYDCILIDLKMPRMNGQELYRLIQESNEKLASRVIFIPGDTVNSKTHDFVTSTGNLIMNKPFQMAELRTHIGQIVGQSG